MEASKQIPSPHYHDADTYAIIRSIPYMRVGGSSLLGLLKQMEAAGRAYAQILPLHPLVSCDPLDLHYVCAKAICALDEDLMSDLLLMHGWRVSNVGAFLALLSPEPKYKELLLKRMPTLSHNQITIDLALAAIDGVCPENLSDRLSNAANVREQLAKIRFEPVPLRVSPFGEYDILLRAEANKIREVYRSQGRSAATALMRTGILGYYNMSYRDWILKGAPPLPALGK